MTARLSGLLLVAALAPACGSTTTSSDARDATAADVIEAGVPEPAPDATREAAPDLGMEAAPDVIADAAPDVAVDAAPDVTVDAAPDVAREAAPEAATAHAAGTIVPLYTYPSDPSWDALVTARQAHPTVRVVAVVNPNNGPGTSRIAAFTTGIAKLAAADVRVIGYVATGYTARGVAAVQADIDRWKTFYPQIAGIFFDEQSNKAADVDFYRTVSQYAKAAGLPFTVGNPGADTAEAYVEAGALDTMLIYESKGLPKLSALGGWHAKYPPESFGVIPYGASFDAAFVRDARKTVGYVFIQNDDLPNPWDTLPPFFGDLLAALE